jgi:hypothetical protein
MHSKDRVGLKQYYRQNFSKFYDRSIKTLSAPRQAPVLVVFPFHRPDNPDSRGSSQRLTMANINPVDNYLHGSWEALGQGAPMLVALAQLCAERWVLRNRPEGELTASPLPAEARAILFAAQARGIIEIRAVNSAFDAAARLLAVYVELSDERTIAFRDPHQPEVTVRFMEGFRELCQRGLIMHHIYRDFSLSPQGMELAKSIAVDEVQHLLDQATEFGLHD